MAKLKPILADSEHCTGCGLCKHVCPTESISMVADAEGFLYPHIADTCIGCHRCERYCPIVSPLKIEIESNIQKGCCGIHKDEAVWKDSSSGGAFSAICQLWGNQNTVIFGAVYDNEQQCVQHRWVRGIDNIGIFRRSKYVQSELGDTFENVRQFLIDGDKVIFSGTPCQVSALRKYLVEDIQDNLLCIDLVCHGVGSPLVFKRYLDFKEKEKKKNIRDFKFRNKSTSRGIHELYAVKIDYDDESEIQLNDSYIDLFLQKLICRPSCDNCIYTSMNRTGDLTIADFKEMYRLIKHVPADRNGSAIICNTQKGQDIFERLPEVMNIYDCELCNIQKFNTPLSKCIPSSARRAEFFEDFLRMNCLNRTILDKYRRRNNMRDNIMHVIPEKWKGIAKRYLEK